MLKVGEMVVYPIHGVARITDIKTEIIGGAKQDCYILQSESTPQRPLIKLPIDKVESNGVRKIVAGDEVDRVIEILKKRRNPGRAPDMEQAIPSLSREDEERKHF